MNIDSIVAALGEASESELSEALAQIENEAQGLANAEINAATVEQLEKLAAAKSAVKGELAARQSLSSRAAAARSAFTAEDPIQQTPGQPENGESPNANTGDPAQPPAPEAAPEGEPDGDQEGEDGVQASARVGKIGKKAPKATLAYAGTVAARTISVGATSETVAGTQLSKEQLASELATRFGQLNKTGINGRHTVARMEFSYPEERRLLSDSVTDNMAKIAAVTEPQALTAAGGFCAPLENQYDINVIGVTDRPVRDSALARFQVSRGGIQYRPPMDALAMTNGLGIWTATDDAAVSDPPDGTPEKTCAVIDCPALSTAVVDAIYLCLQYPNFTARFDPEWVRATTDAAFIAHARFAENNLLSKVLNGSKRLTQAKTVSATRDILVALDKSVAYYRSRHRLNTRIPLRFILPQWVLDLIRADLVRGMDSVFNLDNLAVADSAIQRFFSNRNVNVTWHLDGLAAQDIAPSGAGAEDIPQQFYSNVAAGNPIPPFIDKIDSALYAEGDWLFLDGGTLDLGIVRDSTLNKVNRYQTFVETWEGVAFQGVESLRLVMEVQPTGMAGGTLDLSALTD